MCPARALCVARDAFWHFQIINIYVILVYSPVFNARLASGQVAFKRTQTRLKMICLYAMLPFAGNKM